MAFVELLGTVVLNPVLATEYLLHTDYSLLDVMEDTENKVLHLLCERTV